MVRYFLMFLGLLSINVSAQNSIRGYIYDKKTKQPIEFASVYVSGTTIGTISNPKGAFGLTGFMPPCKIVISHISYDTKEIDYLKSFCDSVSIELNPREVNIHTVDILDENKREQNLLLFRSEFLGSSYWGKHANILNEDALFFEWKYKPYRNYIVNEKYREYLRSKTEIRWSVDSLWVERDVPSILKVSALEPLQVYLPLLGYQLHVDLVDFHYFINIGPNGNFCSYLGYYYFNPIDDSPPSKRIIRNRKKAYYHSRQHFCKSLFDGTLGKNGYLIYEKTDDKVQHLKRIYLDSMMTYSNEIGYLTGCKDKVYNLLFFADSKGYPIDLTQQKGRNPLQSNIFILSDTCLIKPNGITLDSNLSFTPLIGAKKAGASLPEEYSPSTP